MSTYAARDLVRVPGLFSLARLPLGLAFAVSLGRPTVAMGALVLAGLSDIADGWSARRYGQATPTGAVLDAVMDKLFVAIVVVALVAARSLRVTDALLLATREAGELALFAGLAARGQSRLDRPRAPHPLGKVTTVFQYATVAAALFRAPSTRALAIVTGILGLLATLVYWARERGPARALAAGAQVRTW
jgi:phosphatidylglycerophosphate synthase